MKNIVLNRILASGFTLYYFLTSNWIIADLFISPNTKNLVVGIIIFGLLVIHYASMSEYVVPRLLLFYMGLFVALPLLINGSSNVSLLLQGAFMMAISISIDNIDSLLRCTLKYISWVVNIFVIITAVQYVFIFFNPSFLTYAYQITSTGLEMNESARITHWIQYLGLLTNERYEVLGHIMPRFGGYLTEPSAVPNLMLLPKILLWEIEGKITLRNWLFLALVLFLYRSGFVTFYILFYISLILLRRLNILSVIYLISIPSLVYVVFSLDTLTPLLLELFEGGQVYGLANKENTVGVRVLGLYKMISDIEFWGNTESTLFGVGFLFVYLVRFGWLIIVPLIWLFYKLMKQNMLVFHLILFAALFLGKGFSSFAIIILVILYVESSFGNIHA